MEKLTNQEEDIMLRIWRLGRCAVKQIMELLPEPRPPYTTVASIVNNLKRKEYVKAERDGKGYVYSPLIAESDYKRKFLSGFVNNYFKNSNKLNENPNFTNFNRLAPNITGIAKKKVNSAATARLTPIINPPMIVDPDLEVPGKTAATT